MVKYIGYRIQLQHLVMPNKLLLLCVFFFLKKMLIIIKSFNYVFTISFFSFCTLHQLKCLVLVEIALLASLLLHQLYDDIASYDTFLNFLKHFKTLLRVRVILLTLCDIYILVVMYRHSLLLFDSVPGNKTLECISVSYTIENVISLSLKCSSV